MGTSPTAMKIGGYGGLIPSTKVTVKTDSLNNGEFTIKGSGPYDCSYI